MQKEVSRANDIIFLHVPSRNPYERVESQSQFLRGGSRGKASNYRPVSLTSQVCKICESILRDAIVEHLIKNQLIRELQHGFLRGRSCLSNILAFLDKLTDYVDKGTACGQKCVIM